MDEVVRYIEALSDAPDKTNHAQNRKPLVDHLSEAARLVALLYRGAEKDVIRAWVESEEHGYGWGYLEGGDGERAEAAFDRLRRKLNH